MERRRQYAVVVGVVVLAVGGYLIADAFFLPEKANAVEEAEAETGVETLKAGSFTGKAGHEVSGRVELKRDGQGYYLRFENYSQTQGPAVYVYLTAAKDPDETGEVESGLKVPIDGGAEDGEINKVGNFTQRLPADFDPSNYRGVAIWCDDFDVPFGAATLEDA